MEIPDDFDETCGILFIPETIEFPDEERSRMVEEFLTVLAEHLKAPLDPPGGRRTAMPIIVRNEDDLAAVQATMQARSRPRCHRPIRLIPYEEWLNAHNG